MFLKETNPIDRCTITNNIQNDKTEHKYVFW